MINLIKSGVGNIGSVKNALNQIGCKVNIVEKPNELNLNMKKIILPGVGSFDSFIIGLKNAGLFQKIIHLVNKENFSILGICVGLQSFFCKSEEGLEAGMCLIEGDVIKINTNLKVKIPHMGWNELIIKNNNNLLNGLSKNKFYFAHSYRINCFSEKNILGTVVHGEEIPAVIKYKNIYGVQFHPEKSFQQGQKILKNFVDLC